ncbi:Hypothetical protein D9617_27g045600 [Elsinoe fawcettii]|nr:Hypothetical protein D9617_27g045600 [Elsinoe fawcettii]
MKLATISSALALAIPAAVAQRVFNVQTTPQLRFEPPSIFGVQQGDRVRVSFGQIPHNIISSSFENPCQPVSGANTVNSGTLFGPNVFEFIVNTTGPSWYYCSVGRHCNVGPMVFGINPTPAQTLQAVEQRAANNMVQNAPAPAGFGGVVSQGPTGTNSSGNGTANPTLPRPPAFTGGASSLQAWSTVGGAAAVLWGFLAL